MRTAVRKKISVLNYVQEVATIALLVFLIALGGTAVVITNQIDLKLDRFRDSGSVEGITGS